ncbi:MAG: hypothetical protein LBV67_02015 [Streptococcaceae bacterium]|jgi:site-specific recombinase XerD|nr:hypothetical protein [Streptococcaceae bacterium]
MEIRQHSTDSFPYQQSFVEYLENGETVSYETLIDYQKILTSFFFDLEEISLVFHHSKKVTSIKAEDMAIYFKNVRDTYSNARFNKVHTVVSRYYKFLIINRINVPPFPWTIETQRIKRNYELLEVEWEELSTLVQTVDIKEPTSEKNEWINVIAKVIFCLFAKGFTISQISSTDMRYLVGQISVNEQEKKNITTLLEVNSDYLICKRDGSPYKKTQILLFLNELLGIVGLVEHKKGRLTEDARVAYIVKEKLTSRDIAYLFELKPRGLIVERLQSYAQERRK